MMRPRFLTAYIFLIVMGAFFSLQAQTPPDLTGEWKFNRSGANADKKFAQRRSLIFCGDSTVQFLSFYPFTGEEILKRGVVKHWNERVIAVEYLEKFSGENKEGERDLLTLYSEPEFIWITNQDRKQMEVTFSRKPDVEGSVVYRMKKVSERRTCPEVKPRDLLPLDMFEGSR